MHSTMFYFPTSRNIFEGLNFMKTPITIVKKDHELYINHISRLYKELFDLKSLTLEFGLNSRRLDVRHPKLPDSN